MEPLALLDDAGCRRSPATVPSFHRRRVPRNKGLRYPPARRRWRRSSRSYAPREIARMGSACAA